MIFLGFMVQLNAFLLPCVIALQTAFIQAHNTVAMWVLGLGWPIVRLLFSFAMSIMIQKVPCDDYYIALICLKILRSRCL
jgi:hypothetical protein